MSDIAGNVVLITGAGGSLGCSLARVFARAECRVAGMDISDEALARFKAAVTLEGGEALEVKANLRDWGECFGAVERVAERFGGLDILINNATARTTPTFKSLEDCTYEEMTLLAEVGPHAALAMMKAALPHLKKRPGSVINLGSGAGLMPPVGLGPYGMVKAATHTLTRAAAREWAEYGITVNGILPFVETEELKRGLAANPGGFPLPPLGRAGHGERDIGSVIRFLVSPAASFVTGQNLPVDGGVDMMR